MELFINFIARQTGEEQLNRTSPKLQNVSGNCNGTYEKYFEKFQEFYPNIISDKSEFKYYNTDLELKSLISMEAGLENFDSKSSLQEYQDHKDPSVSVTTIGEKFIKYLIE